jgi:hypothetical protein
MMEKTVKVRVNVREADLEFLNQNNISIFYFIEKTIKDIKSQSNDIYSKDFIVRYNPIQNK